MNSTSNIPYIQGQTARKRGCPADSNPHDYRTSANARTGWYNGWREADVIITAQTRKELAGNND